jgi:hypothetical protein
VAIDVFLIINNPEVFRKHLFPHRHFLKYKIVIRYPAPAFFQAFQLSDMMEFLLGGSPELPAYVFIFNLNK